MSESKKKVVWKDDGMNSNYANAVNISFSAEEFHLLFGTRKNWQQGNKDQVVELHNRIIMHPIAAKRLSLLLQQVVKQYETRVGELDTGAVNRSATPQQSTKTIQ